MRTEFVREFGPYFQCVSGVWPSTINASVRWPAREWALCQEAASALESFGPMADEFIAIGPVEEEQANGRANSRIEQNARTVLAGRRFVMEASRFGRRATVPQASWGIGNPRVSDRNRGFPRSQFTHRQHSFRQD